jgi:hypothetical protein
MRPARTAFVRKRVDEAPQVAELLGGEPPAHEMREERRQGAVAERVRRLPQPESDEVLPAEPGRIDVLPPFRAVRDVPLVLQPFEQLLDGGVLGGAAARVDPVREGPDRRFLEVPERAQHLELRVRHVPGGSSHRPLLSFRLLRRYV